MLFLVIFLYVCYGLDLKKLKSKKLDMKSLKDKAKSKDKLLKDKLEKQKKISEKLKILDKKDKYGANPDMKNNAEIDFDTEN